MRALCFAALFSLVGCGARSGLALRDAHAADIDASVPHDASAPADADLPDAPGLDCRGDSARCDDHDACTSDACGPTGACAHVTVVCDDGDACTEDRCVPSLGCTVSVVSCDDHDLCTIDRCDHALGCLRDALVCEDHDPCTANRCDPRAGCVFPPTDCQGCADGSRDGFLDLARYTRIAACAGGFVNAGLSLAVSPTCGRGAGDDGPNPNGVGCNASDLCAPGWHVCLSAGDVAARSPDGCAGALDAEPSSFFATRQTGPGCGHCSTGTDPTCGNNDCRPDCAQTAATTNDIFGCGDLGAVPQASSCRVLDRFSNNLCSSLSPPWRCDADPLGLHESDVVVKPGPAHGGVLCCID